MKDFTQAVGKTFLYLGHERVVRDAYEEKGQLVVITNKGTLRIKPEDFRKKFLPVESDEDRDQQIMVYHGMDDDARSMKSLSDILMENIAKVQADKDYIDRAKAINDSAKTLIDLHRTKIEMIRLVREVK